MLQVMVFLFWTALGSLIFAVIENWHFVKSLYFIVVTIRELMPPRREYEYVLIPSSYHWIWRVRTTPLSLPKHHLLTGLQW